MDTPTAPDPTGAATEHGTLALLITADGGIASVTLPPNNHAPGRALSELVEGRFECVCLSRHLDMWINDYRETRFPDPNVTATWIAGVHGYDRRAYHGPIVITATDARGNTAGLDRTSAALLTDLGFQAAQEGPLRPEEVDGHRARTHGYLT